MGSSIGKLNAILPPMRGDRNAAKKLPINLLDFKQCCSGLLSNKPVGLTIAPTNFLGTHYAVSNFDPTIRWFTGVSEEMFTKASAGIEAFGFFKC